MRKLKLAFGILAVLLASFFAARDARGGEESPAAPTDKLGSVNFPTSCSSEVQPAIEKGVALLHSFQYTESKKTFADAVTREPKCAMAHWGKAMTLYYQLWEFPNAKLLKEGHKEIEAARKLHPASGREQVFLNAAAAFYQKKSKMSQAERI